MTTLRTKASTFAAIPSARPSLDSVISISRNEDGLDAIAAKLRRDGFIDLIEGISLNECIEREAARFEMIQEFWNEPIEVAVALDDSVDSMTKRDE